MDLLTGMGRNFASLKAVRCSPLSFFHVHKMPFSLYGGLEFATTTG